MNTSPDTRSDEAEPPSPEFVRAAMEYSRHVEAGSTDTSAARAAMNRMLEHAPAALKRTFGEKARAMGLLPAPAGCMEDGTPVYAVNDIAAHLGISADDVRSSLGATAVEATAIGTIHTLQ